MHDDQKLLEVFENRERRRSDRREFFRTAIGAAAITAAGASALAVAGSATAQSMNDADVLNFALNLEYLEANFYHFAVFGSPIDAGLRGGTGDAGDATGGRAVDFKDSVVSKYAHEIAADELAHVAYLRRELGAAAVAQPRIDLGTGADGAFSTAARTAGVITGSTATFDPYDSDENFLLGAFIFEDVGVTAYKGAAPLIKNKTYLEAAAGILAVEAYHASLVRTTLYRKGVDTPSLRTSADKISDARDMLDGTGSTMNFDQGISPTGSGSTIASNIVPLDGNGLAFSRSTGQVLNIVYLNGAAVKTGGFFPAGVNGNITTSSAAH